MSEKKAFPTDGMDDGMDLRDYFAAKAVQGILATNPREVDPENSKETELLLIAVAAYGIADAMLKAREGR